MRQDIVLADQPGSAPMQPHHAGPACLPRIAPTGSWYTPGCAYGRAQAPRSGPPNQYPPRWDARNTGPSPTPRRPAARATYNCWRPAWRCPTWTGWPPPGKCRGGGYVANFAQEVVKGQGALSVEGIRQPGSR